MGGGYSKGLIINNNQLNLPNTTAKYILSLLNDIKLSLVCKYWFIYLIPESIDSIICQFSQFENFIQRYQKQVERLIKNHKKKVASQSKSKNLSEISFDKTNNQISDPTHDKLKISDLQLIFNKKIKYKFDQLSISAHNLNYYLSNIKKLTINNLKFIDLESFLTAFSKNSKIGDHDTLEELHLIELSFSGKTPAVLMDWVNNQSNLVAFSFMTNHNSRCPLNTPLPCVSPKKLKSLSIACRSGDSKNLYYDKFYNEHPELVEEISNCKKINSDNNNNNNNNNDNDNNNDNCSVGSDDSPEDKQRAMAPYYENLTQFKLKCDNYEDYQIGVYIIDSIRVYEFPIKHLTLCNILTLSLFSNFENSPIYIRIENLTDLEYLKISKGTHMESDPGVSRVIELIQRYPNLSTLKIHNFEIPPSFLPTLMNFKSTMITKYSFRYIMSHSINYITMFQDILETYQLPNQTLNPYSIIKSLSIDFDYSYLDHLATFITLSNSIERIKLINTNRELQMDASVDYYPIYAKLVEAINSSKSLKRFQIPNLEIDKFFQLAVSKVPFNNNNVKLHYCKTPKVRYHRVEKGRNMVMM